MVPSPHLCLNVTVLHNSSAAVPQLHLRWVALQGLLRLAAIAAPAALSAALDGGRSGITQMTSGRRNRRNKHRRREHGTRKKTMEKAAAEKNKLKAAAEKEKDVK